MTRRGRAWSLTASVAAAALLVSACGGGGSDADDSGDAGGGGGSADAQGGTFNYNLTEPTFLAPAQRCYESECIAVMSVIQEPLLNVDLETGEPVYDGIAESVESDDATTWTITLKDGYTFHNGEEVNADAYIRAWSWSADPENGAETAGFMSKIEGAGEGGEMAGLTKVDDLTFEVKLTKPFSAFPQQLSYTPAFAPIAQECMDDLEACNEEPIGTGPYMMDGPWQHDENITVTRYEDYAGEEPGNADSISFDMYTDSVAAFRAWQGGTLDVYNGVDPTVYPSAQSEAGDRIFEEESSSFNYLGLPIEQEGYSEVDVRHALSMAIDRQEIVDGVLNGLHTPAKDVVSPAVPGSRDDACQYCDFAPEEAKQLFDDTGGLPGTVNLWFNAGSGHDGWVEAIGNGWKDTLGIDFTLESREWAQYLELRSDGAFDGPYRLSWIMDYPSAENYLRPMYGTNGDVNYYGYSNETVDQALDKADSASSPEESIPHFQEASDQVLEDMPVIPLWFGKAVGVWSENVDNVSYSVSDANVDLRAVTVNGS